MRGRASHTASGVTLITLDGASADVLRMISKSNFVSISPFLPFIARAAK